MKTAEPTLGPRRKGAAHNKDLMKGEGKFQVGGRMKQSGGLAYGALDKPASGKRKVHPGGGGNSGKSAYKKGAKVDTKAIGTQSWVAGKIAEGDIEGGMSSGQSGTSIFDPVLCEVAYRWFCPAGGVVLDPFAGGSVRGVVASRLGRSYVGIELRDEQVAANQDQLGIAGLPKPEWRVGDSRQIASLAGDVHADLIFSCPPYWNLEVYSDDPSDLSTFGKEEFFAAQAQVIRDAVARLRPDRFCVWVVGDVRDKAGFYVNLPGRTVEAFEAAGARLYNEIILITAAGSLPIRVGKQFTSGRKVGKTHQNVFVFCKGDWKKAVKACGPTEFGEIKDDEHAERSGAALAGAGIERFGQPL